MPLSVDMLCVLTTKSSGPAPDIGGGARSTLNAEKGFLVVVVVVSITLVTLGPLPPAHPPNRMLRELGETKKMGFGSQERESHQGVGLSVGEGEDEGGMRKALLIHFVIHLH